MHVLIFLVSEYIPSYFILNVLSDKYDVCRVIHSWGAFYLICESGPHATPYQMPKPHLGIVQCKSIYFPRLV